MGVTVPKVAQFEAILRWLRLLVATTRIAAIFAYKFACCGLLPGGSSVLFSSLMPCNASELLAPV